MKRTAYILIIIASVLMLASCRYKSGHKVPVTIEDPDRHYYPVVQGKELDVLYKVTNEGTYALFINEILTSNGTKVKNQLPLVILPGRSAVVHLVYNSLRNMGKVDNYAMLYGNFKTGEYMMLNFDTHVVADADYLHDYEMLYEDASIRDATKGEASDRGYHTDAGVIVHHRKNKAQEKAIDLMNR